MSKRSHQHGTGKAEFKIRFVAHPWIDPTDAGNALIAHLKQSGKSRRRISAERLLEDLFIVGLANQRPWSEEQVRQIAVSSASKDFCERFARALENGRAPLWDKIDLFILMNWRELRTGGTADARLPGLREWHPLAAADLMAWQGLRKNATEEWYITRRKRLNLRGSNRKYRVRDFRFDRQGQPVVDLR